MNFEIKPNFEHFQKYSVRSHRFQRTIFRKTMGSETCYVDKITATLANGVICTPFVNEEPIDYWFGFKIVGDEKACGVSESPIP